MADGEHISDNSSKRVVELIVAHRIVQEEDEFLCKWTDCLEDQNTWQRTQELDCSELLRAFLLKSIKIFESMIQEREIDDADNCVMPTKEIKKIVSSMQDKLDFNALSAQPLQSDSVLDLIEHTAYIVDSKERVMGGPIYDVLNTSNACNVSVLQPTTALQIDSAELMKAGLDSESLNFFEKADVVCDLLSFSNNDHGGENNEGH